MLEQSWKHKPKEKEEDEQVTRDTDDVNYADLVNEVVDGISLLGDLGSNSIMTNPPEPEVAKP